MPDIKGRKDATPMRTRPRPAKPEAPGGFGQDILDEEPPARITTGSAPGAPTAAEP